MNTIQFTRSKLQRLRDAYTMAKRKGADQFEFEGQTILVAYAKYLIQYLESEFNQHENRN